MWFFQPRSGFGLIFGQMAIFRVLCQKHVDFPSSKLVWAEIWPNGDIPGALLEIYGFSNNVQINIVDDTVDQPQHLV